MHAPRPSPTRPSVPPPTAAPAEAEVLRAIEAGVFATDFSGRIVFANDGAAKILRASHDELSGSEIDVWLAPLDRLIHENTNGDSRKHITIVLRDGTRSTIGYSVYPIEREESEAVGQRSGKRPGRRVSGTDFIATHAILFQDISETLELRRQRDRLLQTAAVGEALPTILHELRNPLAAVTAMLELLVEDTEGRIQEDAYSVLSEVRRMNLVLQGVGGVVRSVESHTDNAIDHAVAEACRVLTPAASRKGIVMVMRGSSLPLLRLDRGAISAVVFNLVRNAIDACRSGDKIFVEANLNDDAKQSLTIRVSDTGPGMSADTISRCTDVFFTTKERGSGIGLSLCRQIADASDGELLIESAPDHGTTVSLTVPTRRTTTERRTRTRSG